MYCGDHFSTYTFIESLRSVSETNVICQLYLNKNNTSVCVYINILSIFTFFNVATGKLKVRCVDHMVFPFHGADRDNWMYFYTDAVQLVYIYFLIFQ